MIFTINSEAPEFAKYDLDQTEKALSSSSKIQSIADSSITDLANKIHNIYERSFFFLRHGTSNWNKDMLVLGPQNLPINEKGEAQVKESLELLKNREITCIFTSPLKRCVDTAKIISSGLGDIPVFPINELEERFFGDWSKIKDQVEKLVVNVPEGPGFFQKIKDDIEKILPADAESQERFESRACMGFNKALNCSKKISGLPLIISHGCTKEALKKNMISLKGEDKTKLFTQPIFFQFSQDKNQWNLQNLD